MNQSIGGIVVLCLAASAGGCRSEPASTKSATERQAAPASPPLPRFAKQVGQLEEDNGFLEFIRAHSGNTVDLDITIPMDQFQGGDESTFAFFVVFDECDGLPEGQKPSVPNCTGTEFNIAHAAGAADPLVQEGNARHLRGKFHIADGGGPLQGLMTVRLDPAQ